VWNRRFDHGLIQQQKVQVGSMRRGIGEFPMIQQGKGQERNLILDSIDIPTMTLAGFDSHNVGQYWITVNTLGDRP
jgi:hypothetical protein